MQGGWKASRAPLERVPQPAMLRDCVQYAIAFGRTLTAALGKVSGATLGAGEDGQGCTAGPWSRSSYRKAWMACGKTARGGSRRSGGRAPTVFVGAFPLSRTGAPRLCAGPSTSHHGTSGYNGLNKDPSGVWEFMSTAPRRRAPGAACPVTADVTMVVTMGDERRWWPAGWRETLSFLFGT